MKKLFFILFLSAGIIFFYSCKKNAPVDSTNEIEVNLNDGSSGDPFDGVDETSDNYSSRSGHLVLIDFDDLIEFNPVSFDHYASQGVYIYTGPNGSSGSIESAPSPCNGSVSIMTDPFTGPSILFNFDSPVSNVSVEAGDFGPSDADAMTLTAYSGLNGSGSVLGSITDNLPLNHETGCLPLSLSVSGALSVEVTSSGAHTNSILVDNLAFESYISVVVDIKPGSSPNSINCNNTNQNIPVAILSTDDFDALTVDHTTVSFEGAIELHTKQGEMTRHEKDVNEDGLMDLVFHFKLADSNLDCNSVEGTLTGQTYSGEEIMGSDEVTMK